MDDLKEVFEILNNMKGVLKTVELSNKDILNIIDIEDEEREINFIPVINKGLQECFKRDKSIAIFKRGYFRNPSTPTLLLTFDGEILGHDIFKKEDKEKYENDEDVMFLSDDFIIYRDVLQNQNLKKGNELFILPSVPFPELEVLENLSDIISSSPSTFSDEYLKKEYGYEGDSSVATIIVSFNIIN